MRSDRQMIANGTWREVCLLIYAGPKSGRKRRSLSSDVTGCVCLEENCHACVADTRAMGWRHRGGSGRLLPAPRLACDRVVMGDENMATTSQKKKVEKVMREHKRGTLKS